jgi:hypothetical protein
VEKIPFNKTQGNVNVQEKLRILNKKQRQAVLATDADGQPYTSLVAFALTPDLEGLLFATPKKNEQVQKYYEKQKRFAHDRYAFKFVKGVYAVRGGNNPWYGHPGQERKTVE